MARPSYYQGLPSQAPSSRYAGPSGHDFFQDGVYIPSSQQERQRRSIESHLARNDRGLAASRPSHPSNMSSSTMDTYDKIGREEERYFSSNRPSADHDESLIPGIGRGLRSQAAPLALSSYRDRFNVDTYSSNKPAVKSPYRSKFTLPTANLPSSIAASRRPMPARVETETDSGDESCSSVSSLPDDFASTGNHRAFAATPAGENLTAASVMSQRARKANRPTIGEDTLDRIDFDRLTDNETNDRVRRIGKNKAHSDDPTYTFTLPPNYHSAPQVQQQADAAKARNRHLLGGAKERPSPSYDPRGPLHSPRAAAAFGPSNGSAIQRGKDGSANAFHYQQHLNSRTLTSPHIRTLVCDRTKSPDSPSPAPSISGRTRIRSKEPTLTRGGGARDPSVMTSISAFEDMARRLQRDVESTRRAADGPSSLLPDELDLADRSNSGSGYGPGSQVSSARTKVDEDLAHKRSELLPSTKYNVHGYPDAEEAATTAYPTHLRPGAPNHVFSGASTRSKTSGFGARLPDLTGITSALASPVKSLKHIPVDPAIGSPFTRLEELGHLREFVDGLQTEIDRAGERILNLEESQEVQKEEVDGLRKEVESVWKDVKEVRGGDFVKQIVERIREEERSLTATADRPASDGVDPESRAQQQQQERRREQAVQASAAAAERQREQAVQAAAAAAADDSMQTHVDNMEDVAIQPRATSKEHAQPPTHRHPTIISQGEHTESVQRLYSELDRLRSAMEEQFRRATGEERRTTTSSYEQRQSATRGRHSSGDGELSRDPWEAIEALRIQVVYLAGEVEKLNELVVEEIVEPRKAERFTSRSAWSAGARRSTQEHVMEAGRESRARVSSYPASDPVYHHDEQPLNHSRRSPQRQYEEEREADSEPVYSARASTPPHSRRSRVSFSHPDPDETIDAVAENTHCCSTEEADISTLAEARAERAFESLSKHTSHDAKHCTVCLSSETSATRKAARKSKAEAREKRREAVETEETLLLSSQTLSSSQLKTLHKILHEHWDEFLHQRMLYAELADELKLMSPRMSKSKRQILAQHVLEAVEMLELKADRISRLEKLLHSFEENGPKKRVTPKAKKVALQRQGRNSPPTINLDP